MEYCVLLSTEFLLFCALLFYVDEFPDEWNKPALGYLCIISVVGSSLLIAFLMLLDFISQWREDRAQRKKELELLNNMVAQSEDPLFKFKEKRRQATAIVEIKDEDKDKVDDQSVQPTNLVPEQTLPHDTIVDLNENKNKHVPDVPQFVPHEDTHLGGVKNESLLHDVHQEDPDLAPKQQIHMPDVPQFDPEGYDDDESHQAPQEEEEVHQIVAVNQDQPQAFQVEEVQE